MIPITDQEFDLMASFIQKHYGIHLKKEKKALMIGRLHKVLTSKGVNSFTEYYEYLCNDTSGDAVAELVDRISTNHTFFMREADHFDFFRSVVLPDLKSSLRRRDLRVWCAASSSGEEPYTLAMIINDVFEDAYPHWDTKILATDISNDMLKKAQDGVYENQAVKSLPDLWVKKYFVKKDADTMQVTSNIKSQVIYRRLNLMDHPFPFKEKLHVIFCRNVMIYFDQVTKDRLVAQFYNLLEDGGYLFIGHSEAINRKNNPFVYIRPSVYRKMTMRRDSVEKNQGSNNR